MSLTAERIEGIRTSITNEWRAVLSDSIDTSDPIEAGRQLAELLHAHKDEIEAEIAEEVEAARERQSWRE
jgi:hypothetical protein